MKLSCIFENGESFDMSDFKGEFTYQNIVNHYGEEIADKIMEANPYHKMSKGIAEALKKSKEKQQALTAKIVRRKP